MGQLARKLYKIDRAYWSVASLMLLMLMLRPAMAAYSDANPSLTEHLLSGGSLTVGEQTRGDYRQVHYEYRSSKHFIGDKDSNNYGPVNSGRYVAWINVLHGAGHVVLHDALSGSTVRLSVTGTNLNPYVTSDGRVVWEAWVGDRWQIFYFDGNSVRKITAGDVAINAIIDGNSIVYARQDIEGRWSVESYNTETEKVEVLLDDQDRWLRPAIKDGQLVY